MILAIFFMAFGLSTQQCGSIKDHPEIYDAYFDQRGEVLGKGGFGKVRQFIYGKKVYAVKEISITMHKKMLEKLNEATPKIRKAVSSFHEMMDSFPFFETLFKDKIVAEFISELYPGKKKTKEWIWNYFLVMREIANLANQEVAISGRLSQAFDSKPDAMPFKFHFCIRETGLNMLLFFDKFGDQLNSLESQDFISKKPMGQRFEIYLQILRRIKNVHDQRVVHCDLKHANILWASKSRRDIVIIDYGISTFGTKCQGGTYGYQAPELTIESDLKNADEAFKADVYSFGMMVAEDELTRVNPSMNIVALQKEYQLQNILYDRHSSLLKNLKNYIKGARDTVSNINPLLKSTYKLFYEQFELVMNQLLETNVAARADLNQAYRHMWYLYQQTRFLNSDAVKFDNISIDLRSYLHQYKPKSDYFGLPMDWSPSLFVQNNGGKVNQLI
jgi:serine/threonine protein kinase